MKLAIFVLVLFVSLRCSGLSFTVDAHKEECLYEEVDSGTRIASSFQVATGGFLDIDFKILGPDGKIIYSGERETEGRYTFVAHETGNYEFCFGNKMSTVTPKTISFSVIVGDSPEEEHITPLENSVRHLAEGLSAMQSEQKYMVMRERVHRNTSESTNGRVMWWSFFEAVILVAMSLWQIYYLRRFFEVKRVV